MLDLPLIDKTCSELQLTIQIFKKYGNNTYIVLTFSKPVPK